jgi:riboflavin synthase
MFTGLIEEVGVVRGLHRSRQGGTLDIRAESVMEGTKVGDSIAVSGACLTVVALDGEGFTVECMPETLSRTTLGRVGPGSLVNLERSLAWGGRLGGHLVLGHVDDVGEVLSVHREGIALIVRISMPPGLAGCVTAKGSIAVDGVSLTVLEADDTAFEVGLIPHTVKKTTLRAVKTGVRVNLEADVLARYVMDSVRRLTGDAAPSELRPRGLTEGFLREQGFA